MRSNLDKTIRELKIRDYIPRTIKNYKNGLTKYFSFKNNNLNQLDVNNINNFLLYCKNKNLSAKTRNQYPNAIKFYYYNVINIRDKIKIRTAKRKNVKYGRGYCLSAFGGDARPVCRQAGELISWLVDDILAKIEEFQYK